MQDFNDSELEGVAGEMFKFNSQLIVKAHFEPLEHIMVEKQKNFVIRTFMQNTNQYNKIKLNSSMKDI